MTGPAHIIDLEDFSGIRDNLGKIVATSGGYDPIHPGHTSCLLESKKFGDSLIVIVNGDGYLRRKKRPGFYEFANPMPHRIVYKRGRVCDPL